MCFSCTLGTVVEIVHVSYTVCTTVSRNSHVIVIFCATVVTLNAEISRKISYEYICCGRMSAQDDLPSDIWLVYKILQSDI